MSDSEETKWNNIKDTNEQFDNEMDQNDNFDVMRSNRAGSMKLTIAPDGLNVEKGSKFKSPYLKRVNNDDDDFDRQSKNSNFSNSARLYLKDRNKDTKQKLLKVIEISRYIHEKYRGLQQSLGEAKADLEDQVESSNSQYARIQELIEHIESKDQELTILKDEMDTKEALVKKISYKLEQQVSKNSILDDKIEHLDQDL